jgi:hypothetical protein
VSAETRSESPRRSTICVERHVSLNEQNLPSRDAFAIALNDLFGDERVGENAYVVGTGPLDYEFREIMRARGVADDRIASVTSQHGYSVGSSAGAALVATWDKATSGDSVVIVHCGDGLSAKVVLMRN